jgi:hypothetical protein
VPAGFVSPTVNGDVYREIMLGTNPLETDYMTVIGMFIVSLTRVSVLMRYNKINGSDKYIFLCSLRLDEMNLYLKRIFPKLPEYGSTYITRSIFLGESSFFMGANGRYFY